MGQTGAVVMVSTASCMNCQSLSCTPETSVTFCVNYTQIKTGFFAVICYEGKSNTSVYHAMETQILILEKGRIFCFVFT